MSTTTATDLGLLDADAPRGRQASLRAFRGLMRLEWRRQLMTPRVLWPLLLALLPDGITSAIVWVAMRFAEGDGHGPPEGDANPYHGPLVRVVPFFGRP